MLPPHASAIQVTQLCKTYQLYSRHSDRLKEALHPMRKKFHTTFFALRDLSLQVSRGEALGILGRNGSGKSTLLKIITGVLTPTSGQVHVLGTVSAILELGAGFDPEMTGMENIYFNGTIQGRERDETERVMPDILAFADIGEYIHQPVKTYSSGMFARLAFALAVNVDPDILIVDEALSVGDMRFQQKCLRRMGDFRDQGKTILFVSHDATSVTAFCDRALWLDQGQVRELGDAQEVCKHYAAYMSYGDIGVDPHLSSAEKTSRTLPVSREDSISWQDISECDSFGEGGTRILAIALQDDSVPAPLGIVRPGQIVQIHVKFITYRVIDGPGVGFLLKNHLGQCITRLNNYLDDTSSMKKLDIGLHFATFIFPFPLVSHGQYTFSVAVAEGSLSNHVQLHWVHDALCIEVSGGDMTFRSDCLLGISPGTWRLQMTEGCPVDLYPPAPE